MGNQRWSGIARTVSLALTIAVPLGTFVVYVGSVISQATSAVDSIHSDLLDIHRQIHLEQSNGVDRAASIIEIKSKLASHDDVIRTTLETVQRIETATAETNRVLAELMLKLALPPERHAQQP